MHTNLRALVINSDMSPIELPFTAIPVQDAVIRIFNGTCEVVESYDTPIACIDPTKLIPYNLTCWPSVIVRTGKIARRATNEPVMNLRNLYIRDEGICAYTGEHIKEYESSIDHVVPLSKGGTNEWDNVVLAKNVINHEKADNMPIGKWKPKRLPYKPTYWNLFKLIRKKPLYIDHSSWLAFIGKWEGPIYIKEENKEERLVK